MGFIVHNDVTYPTFVRLLGELGVATQASDMSLGSACRACGVEFSSRGAARLVRPAVGRAAARSLADVRRHPAVLPRRAGAARRWRRVARRRSASTSTTCGFGAGFRDHFLVPITSAVWSTASDRILEFPIDYLLRFLDHHGLIGVGRALQWRTITGGSMTYVERIVAAAAARTRSAPATRSWTSPGPATAVTVRTAAGASDTFDAVVLATHADDALRLLHDADARERAALGGFEYSTNRVVLHTDAGRPAAPARRAGRRGTSTRPDCRRPERGAHDDLPHEPAAGAARDPSQYCVSVNPDDRLDPSRDHRRAGDAPPAVHVRDARRAGSASATLQGWRRTFYAGAHLGYGFHEDGCRSGLRGRRARARHDGR